MRYEESFYTSPEWRELRYEALRVHGAACQCCGRTRKDGIVIHVDHIKPRSKYPHLELELSNLQILCDDCNLGKLHKDETDWREPEPVRERNELESLFDKWAVGETSAEENNQFAELLKPLVQIPKGFGWQLIPIKEGIKASVGFDERDWWTETMIDDDTQDGILKAFARSLDRLGDLLSQKQGAAKNRFNWANKKRTAAETALIHAELAADEYIRGEACQIFYEQTELEHDSAAELTLIFDLRARHKQFINGAERAA